MPRFTNSPPQNADLVSLLSRPRYLRAIPSLVVLTTAMVWGVASQAGELAMDGAVRGAPRVTVAAGPAQGGVGLSAHSGVKAASGMARGEVAGDAGVSGNADVRSGANSNITAEERMAAMGSAAAETDASGSVKGVSEDANPTAGGATDMGKPAMRTGKRASHGVKAKPSDH